MLLSTLVTLVGLAHLATAQTVTPPANTPACLANCAKTSCPTLDQQCMCVTQLSAITACATTACTNPNDVQLAIQIASAICSNVASSAVAGTGTSAAASGTATSASKYGSASGSLTASGAAGSTASATGGAQGTSSSAAGTAAATSTAAGATSAGTQTKVVSYAVVGIAAIAAGFALS